MASSSNGYPSFENDGQMVQGGEARIEEADANLIKFRDRVDTGIKGERSALTVVVGSGAYAFRLEDGVWVVTI